MRDTHQHPLNQLPEFGALSRHAQQAREWQLAELFREDASRAARFTLEASGLCIDYSKNHLNEETIRLLTAFAQARGVETLRDAMFRGDRINLSEQRAVLHTALRLPPDARLSVEGEELVGGIQQELGRMASFAERVRQGDWKGYTGREITDVVNIGIGGSDLGPMMTVAALRVYAHPRLRFHFLSNVDGHATTATLAELDPATTLFIVASKSFTTQETMLNAHAARRWFLQHARETDLAAHFVAVSTNTSAVTAFGIAADNMFPFRDWVGGRFSIWSSIGLSLLIAIGSDHFREFLSGGHAMDEHFRLAPLNANMPVILALLAFWYREYFETNSQLIAPYHEDLRHFPAYLQQLEMESNGKRVTRDSKPVSMKTSPVIWGSAGTNNQHAYFQMLHQGSDLIPVDFIAALKPRHDLIDQQRALMANCFAQAEALMNGVQDPSLPPHRIFPGNRPSTMLLMDQLSPASLGALIALYEHKTFVLGALWDINSFDQWGVELGKTMALRILAELEGSKSAGQHDSSTNALIARARSALK
ncbi:MAG: glucose-6-phosphate isomerase [Oxalobacteraceae bacterium]|nr:glucose-6-phosphate isomerase [Oxalobacteraceae bacterium]